MKWLRICIGLVVSAAALYLVFRKVDLSAVGRALLAANYGWIALATLLVGLSILLRARRWQVLFAHGDRLHLSALFGVLNVGYLVNTFVPLRAGELVRVLLLRQLEPVSRLETLGTIVVERAVDTLGLIVLLLAVLPFVHVSGGWATPVLMLATLVVLLLVTMAVIAAQRATALRLVGRLTPLLPQRLRGAVAQQAELAIAGFASLTDVSASGWVAALTAVIYLILAAAMEAVLLAFHLTLPPATAFFLLAAVTLGLVVPASPAAVGIWEGIAIAVLTGVFAVERSVATSVALVSHVVFTVPCVVLGAGYLWRLGASWRTLLRLGDVRRRQPDGALELPPAD